MATRCPKCHAENIDTLKFCGECGTPLAAIKPEGAKPEITETLEVPKKELTTGSTFAGRYQVIEELGRGGMGRVYKVFDADIKEKVALKLLKPEIASDRETIERFSNELRLARRITHRHVCRMYDLGKAEGAYFITMEYVHGEDLKSMLQMMGELSPGQVVSIGKQVCDGLAEAHSLGVVHRDLKPQNIMIDKAGNVKIMDFGIARSVREKGITGPSVLIGTPEYMSPEQAEAREVDQRSDIYSLGIILYEMATGRVPFEGETALSIAMKHKGEMPKNPKDLNPHLSDDLSSLILKCLEKDRAKRYQTAAELRSALEKIEKGIPTTQLVVPKPKSITSKEITVKFTLRKLFVPALAVVGLIIAAIVIWKIMPKKKVLLPPSGKPTVAVLYFENNTGEESLENWRSGLCDLLITDLSQSKYIDVLGSDQVYSVLSKLNLLEKTKYSAEDIKKVASELGANHIVRGSYITAGPKFIVNVAISKADLGKAISSFKEEGQGEESIPGLIDKITLRIKTDLNLSQQQIAADIDDGVGKITSGSPEALKCYLEGLKFYRPGQFSQAMPFFEKAVSIDPEFAMANIYLARCRGLLGNRSDRQKYLRRAVELSERISERERYYILGVYYQLESQKTWDKAIEASQKLLNLYPDSPYGHSRLIGIYLGLEDWEKSLEHFEKMRHFTGFGEHYLNQSIVLSAQGMYDKAREILEYMIKNVGEHPNLRHFLAWTYLAQGQYELALAEVDMALPFCQSTYPGFLYINFRTRGDIQLCSGELSEAENSYRKLLEMDIKPQRLYGFRGLASLYLLQGMFHKSEEFLRQGISLADELGEKAWASDLNLQIARLALRSGHGQKALQACEDALVLNVDNDSDIDRRIRILHLKGIILLENGRIKEAQGIADDLKRTIESWLNPKLIRYHDNLMGRIELKRGNTARAVERFEAALSLVPYQKDSSNKEDQAIFLEPLAQAHFQSGDFEKARETYEKIVSLTSGRIRFGDIYAKSFYMLGNIYEKSAKRKEATANYRRFLDLWKDADPGWPEVDEAKARLAVFEGSEPKKR